MNRSTDIINFLAQTNSSDVLIVAPNAPPVVRTGSAISVALNRVFDAQDVTDTLAAFRARALASTPREPESDAAGSFSFGIKDLGRFRVSFATQRGSRIMTVSRIPYVIPATADVCETPEVLEAVCRLTAGRTPGFLTVSGPSAVGNSLAVYMVLRNVNETERKVIYILERSLTFLMSHGNSLAIQCELAADVKTVEAGIQNAFMFEPDIIYIGDVRAEDRLTGLGSAAVNGALVIASSTSLGAPELFERLLHGAAALDRGTLRASLRVQPRENGRLALSLSRSQPGE